MKYTAIGADIFAGGFAAGVQEYFEIKAHLEHNNYGQNVKDLNLPYIPTYIKPWPFALFNQLKPVDFVFTNPPCAPFSSASNGRGTTWDQDSRLSCFDDCFDLLFELEPKALAIESVLAAWRKASSFMLEKARIANEAGYAATVILHDGKWHNLPQSRRRMFLTFHKYQLPWYKYQPQKVRTSLEALVSPPVVYSDDDAILKINEHTAFLLRNARPEDNTLVRVHDRLGFSAGSGSKRPVYTSSICHPWKPAPTLLHCFHKHPTEPRFLTIREMARLCGFPDWWSWGVKASVQAKSSLIARGVTPPVAEWLAKLVYDSFEEAKPAKAEIHIVDLLNGQFTCQVIQ